MIASKHVALFALVLAALPACGSASVEQPTASAAQGETTRAPLAVDGKGPMKVAVEAFADVPLRADQRSELEQIFQTWKTRHEPVRQARQAIMLAAADQIEAGSLDKAALAPKIDAAADAWTKAEPDDRAAIERVHALLTPDQRVALVDAISAKMEEHHKRHERVAGEGADKPMGPMKQWGDDLGLTDDQRSKLHEAMRSEIAAHFAGRINGTETEKPELAFLKMKTRFDNALEAFKTDHFVMDEVMPREDAKARAQKMSDHVLHFAEVAMPILTPDQRVLAAKKLRERAGEGAE